LFISIIHFDILFTEEIYIFLIFHVAIPLLLFELPYIKERFKINRFSLILGSLYPDIIDKSLMFLSLGAGRGYVHSFFFISISFLVLFLITKGNASISIPFLIGTIIHLVLDMPYVPLFYPFIQYEFIILEDPIGSWLETLFTNPIIITTEISGLIILIFIMIHNKLYGFTPLVDYFLKTNRPIINDKTNKIKKNNNTITE